VPARLTKAAPTFVVHDVVRTAEYYRDTLGFTILGYFLDPPVFAMVARDGVEIHFGKPDTGEVSESIVGIRKVGVDIYIWTSDIAAIFEELSASGADIIEGPVRRIYESTEVVIKDCNGLRIAFGE
jgi:predicted enzyme related to lactoylglutathione lyase